MLKLVRSPWVWVPSGFIVALLILFTLLPAGDSGILATPSEFVEDARAGRVQKIEVNGRYVDYRIDGIEEPFEMKMEEGQTVRALLSQAGLEDAEFPPIETASASWWSRGPFFILAFLPILLIIAVLFALLRWLWRKGSVGRA
jgi:hypothetical protein